MRLEGTQRLSIGQSSRQRAFAYGKSDSRQIKLGWKILSYLPFSPDILHMQDRQFRTQEELEKKLNNFFVSKDHDFYRSDIYKLDSCWEKI